MLGEITLALLFFIYILFYLTIVFNGSLLVYTIVLSWNTFLFMIIIKGYWHFATIIGYWAIQELCGIFILINAYWPNGVVLFLLGKAGAAPLHFWVIHVCSEIPGEVVMWFISIQKLPYVFVISQILYNKMFWFLLLGITVCSLQAILFKGFRQMVFVGSSETLGWALLWMGIESTEGGFSYTVYTYVTWGLFCRAVERSDFEGVETFMWVSNSPGLLTFYLKVFYMGSLVESWLGVAIVIVTLMSFLQWTYLYFTQNLSVWNKNTGLVWNILFFLNLGTMF